MDNLQCIWDAKAELGEGVRYEPATNQVWWVDILGHKIYRLDNNNRGKKLFGKRLSLSVLHSRRRMAGCLRCFADRLFV